MGMEHAYNLGCLSIEGIISDLGRRLLILPLETELSKSVLTSIDSGAEEEVITISALLEVNIDISSGYKKKEYKNLFEVSNSKLCGDHIVLLSVFKEWKAS